MFASWNAVILRAGLCGLAAIGVAGSLAVAQSYPTGLIRIVLASGPGTPPDVISRIVTNELQQSEGWRFVVENKLGAMQTLAGAEVLKAPADGHSIVSVSLPGMTAPALLPNLSIRMESDFVPVVKLSSSYNVLVVHPSVPAHSVTELVALLKSKPDQMTFSSGGFGTPAHLIGELFKVRTGVRVTHVPYQQLPQAVADLLGGRNHYQFVASLQVIDLVATGRLRALAVTAPHRIAALKDVPTVAEAGFPELEVADWVGYLMKASTPDAAVARVNQAVNKALQQSAVREAMAKIGAEPAGGTADEFRRFVIAQLDYWGKVVRDSGMKMHQ